MDSLLDHLAGRGLLDSRRNVAASVIFEAERAICAFTNSLQDEDEVWIIHHSRTK